jgi:hypothetical protein
VLGKIVKGSSFEGVLQYVLEKEGAELLESNMGSINPLDLASEFRAIAELNQRVKYPVVHISLSPHPEDKLAKEDLIELSRDYLQRMDLGESQYVIAQHHDTYTSEGLPRPHLHIIANRVRLTDNQVTSSWLDWERSQEVLRDLENEYGLQQVASSSEIQRSAPSTGQKRRERKEQQKHLLGELKLPPQPSVKEKLQTAIDETVASSKTMSDLLLNLESVGVEPRVRVTREGEIQGISYQLEGVAFQGRQLGKGYTLKGLQKRGIGLDLDRDGAAIAKSSENIPVSVMAQLLVEPEKSSSPIGKDNNTTSDNDGTENSTATLDAPEIPEIIEDLMREDTSKLPSGEEEGEPSDRQNDGSEAREILSPDEEPTTEEAFVTEMPTRIKSQQLEL